MRTGASRYIIDYTKRKGRRQHANEGDTFMLVVKTLELVEEAPVHRRSHLDGFTADRLTIKYGATLAGLRFNSVHINVDPSKRDDRYDAYVKAHQAYQGHYETMREVDERNAKYRQAAPKTRTTEEMREYLGEGGGDTSD